MGKDNTHIGGYIIRRKLGRYSLGGVGFGTGGSGSGGGLLCSSLTEFEGTNTPLRVVLLWVAIVKGLSSKYVIVRLPMKFEVIRIQYDKDGRIWGSRGGSGPPYIPVLASRSRSPRAKTRDNQEPTGVIGGGSSLETPTGYPPPAYLHAHYGTTSRTRVGKESPHSTESLSRIA